MALRWAKFEIGQDKQILTVPAIMNLPPYHYNNVVRSILLVVAYCFCCVQCEKFSPDQWTDAGKYMVGLGKLKPGVLHLFGSQYFGGDFLLSC